MQYGQKGIMNHIHDHVFMHFVVDLDLNQNQTLTNTDSSCRDGKPFTIFLIQIRKLPFFIYKGTLEQL